MIEIEYITDFIVFPEHINSIGTLFGGVLLGKMDIAAATLARKIQNRSRWSCYCIDG